MRELIIRGAIATVLEVFQSTPHLIAPLRPALLKMFETLWVYFQYDPDFQSVVGKAALKAQGAK